VREALSVRRQNQTAAAVTGRLLPEAANQLTSNRVNRRDFLPLARMKHQHDPPTPSIARAAGRDNRRASSRPSVVNVAGKSAPHCLPMPLEALSKER